MTRVKRGTIARARRKTVFKFTKGFRHGRKSKYVFAKEAMLHAGTHAFRDRKTKKRNMRALWQIQINAAARQEGLSYSKLINALTKKKIGLNRKILAEIAQKHPEIFQYIVSQIK